MNRRLLGDLVKVSLVVGFALGGSLTSRPVQADDPPTDPFKANTMWHGTCEQSNPKLSYPMVLFIKQRKASAFEAVIWYPTLSDGLVNATGKVDPKGAVTFTEDKVIHGEDAPGKPGIVAGSKFAATLDRTTLKGTGEWSNPKTKEQVTLNITLKLAE